MKYSSKLKGKVAEIIATPEQLQSIGLSGAKTIRTGARVAIVKRQMRLPIIGDVVLVDEQGDLSEDGMYSIPLSWLQIIEEK